MTLSKWEQVAAEAEGCGSRVVMTVESIEVNESMNPHGGQFLRLTGTRVNDPIGPRPWTVSFREYLVGDAVPGSTLIYSKKGFMLEHVELHAPAA